MRPSLTTDRISLGLWLNIRFVVNYGGAFRSIFAIVTWFSYYSVNLLRLQNCIYLPSDLSCLYKLNCNIFNHHEILYFLCIGPHQQSTISSGWLWSSWWRQAAEPSSWLRNDLSIPRAPENMSHKNIVVIYFHIWAYCNPIIGIFRACRDISINILIYRRQPRDRHLISPTRYGCTAHSEMRYLQV